MVSVMWAEEFECTQQRPIQTEVKVTIAARIWVVMILIGPLLFKLRSIYYEYVALRCEIYIPIWTICAGICCQ